MKNKILFISILTFFLIFQLTKAQTSNTNKTSNTTKAPDTTKSSTLDIDNNLDFLENMDLSEFTKPSKAFTAVILVYFGLIVVGAILVLVLVKPLIEN